MFPSHLLSSSFGRAFSLSLPLPSFGARELHVSVITSDTRGMGGIVRMGIYYLSVTFTLRGYIVMFLFFWEDILICGLNAIPTVLFLREHAGGVIN